ncbi:MAG: hypothetical protein FWG87_07090 [Defluviitaleaceae bacterium]|nr:hypothetical protein [Defluviitaleaceae bacterium]
MSKNFKLEKVTVNFWWSWLRGLILALFALGIFGAVFSAIGAGSFYLEGFNVFLFLVTLIVGLFVVVTVTSGTMVYLYMVKDISDTNALTSKIASDLEEIKKHLTDNNE